MKLDLSQRTNSSLKELPGKEIVGAHEFINKLNSAERDQITRSPMLIERYRWDIWNTEGKVNANQLLEEARNQEESHDKDAEDILKKLSCSIVKKYKTNIDKEKAFRMLDICKYVCILDSRFLFQAGAYSPLLSTIEAINAIEPEMVIIILWDQNMTLFPELFNMIIREGRNIIVVDTTLKPLQITKTWREVFRNVTFDKVLLETNKQTKRRELIMKTSLLVGTEIEHARDVGNQLKVEPYLSLWGRYYSKESSKDIIRSSLSLKKNIDEYIVYHSRSGAYKFKSKHRDGKGLNQRKEFVQYIKDKGLHIFVLGAVDEKDKEVSDGITYINEIENQDSSFQLHLLHGSTLIVGGPSGMTHLATVVSTPLLMIDSPYPVIYPAPKEKEYKIIMRELDGGNSCLSRYFECDPTVYYEMPCHLPHVLEEKGLKISPSTDYSLIKGTEEMLHRRRENTIQKQSTYSKIKNTILDNVEERYAYIRHLPSILTN